MNNQHPLKENLIGEKFNQLTVTDFASNHKNRTSWKCLCDCGNIKIIISSYLKNGNTKSCGCLNNKKRKLRSKIMYSANIKYTPQEASARRVWLKNYGESNLEFKDFYKLSQENCYYCDAAPQNIYKPGKDDKKASKIKKEEGVFIYNGLDRVDNNLGHTINNVVTCCKWCNLAKRDRSVEDFKNWISSVYNYLINKRK